MTEKVYDTLFKMADEFSGLYIKMEGRHYLSGIFSGRYYLHVNFTIEDKMSLDQSYEGEGPVEIFLKAWKIYHQLPLF